MIRWFFALGLFCLSLRVMAGLHVVLQQPADTIWKPDSSLAFQLADIPAGILMVEVDGVDLTARLQFRNNRVVLPPVGRWAVGEHDIRLLLETPGGDLLSLGQWQIEVKADALQASGSVQGEVALNRLVDEHPAGTSPTWHREGALQGSFSVQGPRWKVEGRAEAAYDSEGLLANGDQASLDTYSLTASDGVWGLTAGHQSLADIGLLYDGDPRRGIAVSGTASRAQVSLFAARPDTIARFGNTLGVDDEYNRVTGARLQSTLKDGANPVRMQATVYEGHQRDTVWLTEQAASGWAAVLEGQQGALAWKAALAHSSWDADGRGTLVGYEEDTAWTLGADYRFAPFSNGWAATLSMSHGRVGPYFVSLLNPVQQNDQLGTRAQLALEKGEWRHVFGWQALENNVDHDPSLPVTRVQAVSVDSARHFQTPWLGHLSSINLSIRHTGRQDFRIPAGYLGTPIKDETLSAALDTQWEMAGGVLAFGGGVDQYQDHQASSNDSDTRQLYAQYDRTWLLTKGTTLQLAPAWSWNETTYPNLGIHSTSTLVQVTGQLAGLAGGRLNLSLAPAWQRDRDVSSSLDQSIWSLSGGLNYALYQRDTWNVIWSFSGSYQQQQDHVLNTTTERWQAYTGLRMRW